MASPLMNLCDPVFKATITCNTISSEGYEVTNLLSDDSEKRRKGFLGDRFIKPPIEITLKFPFDINIRYIQISAEVGQQKSSGIEVYTSSVPYNSSLCSGCSVSKTHTKSDLVCSPTAERIVSVVLNNGERGLVIFCPLQYGRQSPNPVPNIRADFVQRSMMWKKRSVIAHMSSLILRIFRTHGSSVIAVGSIEVWGGPSSCMPPTQVSKIETLWNSTLKKQCEDTFQGVKREERFKQPILSVQKKSDDLVLTDIPEEYLDAITWEIMALPMVLPSGKVVDQQTLDHHAQAEANWGRHPSDPFTGILFSDGFRPVLDSALKSRIDRFLVLNQDRTDLKTVPRTVGRAQPQICHQSISRFRNNRVCFNSVDNNRKQSQLTSSASHMVRFRRPGLGLSENLPSCSSHQNPRKYNDFEVSETVTKKPKLSENAPRETECKNTAPEEQDVICLDGATDPKTSDDMKSHERKLDDSLDFALKSVLSGLPSFVNPPAPKSSAKECSSCKIAECLYLLPCTHFLCRSCLVRVSKLKPSACQTCHIEFKSCDPVLHHD